MAFFRKRKTIRRCRTLATFVNGIDEPMVDRMARFLLEDKRNTVQVTREYLMFVTAMGVISYTVPITPARDDYEAIAISSSWAKVAGPYGRADGGGDVGTTTDAGSSTYDDRDGDDGAPSFGSWTSFGDSDGSDFTNNNNNNNNNNNG